MDEDYQAEAINLDELHEEYPSVNKDVSKIKMQIENSLTLIELEGSANEVDGAEVIYSKMDGDQARAVPEGRNEDGLQMKKGSEAIYPKMDGDQARAVPEEGNEDVYLKVKFSWDENAKSKRKKSFLLIKNSKRPKKEDKAQNIDGEAELCDVFSDFCNNDDSRGSLIVGQPDKSCAN
ncbi:hypothetical protein DAPPUDRAFT_113758 [Daphnia pulex]|uniref:Uncharacterized protein n=1 Tax=Daphnia pulex TaxID=6669 RepID=E9HG03_DAPPU|nr:hypothetical protein DAPPUDRAFT_113758 [Daphnia pulex]|eukprot:EFX69343.1 hypothetical protein DAPPUDRAFT_113758 [Daphnia pulex]